MKITQKTQFQNIKHLLILLLMLLGIMLWMSREIYMAPNILALFGFVALLQIIPTIYIHVRYYLKNKSQEFFIFPDRIEVIDKGIKTVYKSDEIKKIIIYMSPNINRGRIAFGQFEVYHFARVKLKNGNELILTSLLHYDLSDVLKENIKGVLFAKVDSIWGYFPDWKS